MSQKRTQWLRVIATLGILSVWAGFASGISPSRGNLRSVEREITSQSRTLFADPGPTVQWGPSQVSEREYRKERDEQEERDHKDRLDRLRASLTRQQRSALDAVLAVNYDIYWLEKLIPYPNIMELQVKRSYRDNLCHLHDLNSACSVYGFSCVSILD